MLLLLILSMFPVWIITFRHINLNWKSLVRSEKLASYSAGEEQTPFLTPLTRTPPELSIFRYFEIELKILGLKSFFCWYITEVQMFLSLSPGVVTQFTHSCDPDGKAAALSGQAAERTQHLRSQRFFKPRVQSNWYGSWRSANCSQMHKGNAVQKHKIIKGIF